MHERHRSAQEDGPSSHRASSASDGGWVFGTISATGSSRRHHADRSHVGQNENVHHYPGKRGEKETQAHRHPTQTQRHSREKHGCAKRPDEYASERRRGLSTAFHVIENGDNACVDGKRREQSTG